MTRFLKTLLLALLRGYKAVLSPFLPPACRYVPTCSEYAVEAIERYGAFRGSAMAMWRVLRCHPFVRGGYDPMPWNDAPAATPTNRRTAGGGCPHTSH
jgi:putative membrane protein insertion efficiency factor